jgi:hypothetical protein
MGGHRPGGIESGPTLAPGFGWELSEKTKMKLNYSPGPWNVLLPGSGGSTCCIVQKLKGEPFRRIATVECQSVTRGLSTDNAKLVAAAPELLSALEGVLSAGRGRGHTCENQRKIAFREARSVLAKLSRDEGGTA